VPPAYQPLPGRERPASLARPPPAPPRRTPPPAEAAGPGGFPVPIRRLRPMPAAA